MITPALLEAARSQGLLLRPRDVTERTKTWLPDWLTPDELERALGPISGVREWYGRQDWVLAPAAQAIAAAHSECALAWSEYEKACAKRDGLVSRVASREPAAAALARNRSFWRVPVAIAEWPDRRVALRLPFDRGSMWLGVQCEERPRGTAGRLKLNEVELTLPELERACLLASQHHLRPYRG